LYVYPITKVLSSDNGWGTFTKIRYAISVKINIIIASGAYIFGIVYAVAVLVI
jgi:hypothetical protein